MPRTSLVKSALICVSILIVSSANASAQYNWTVTKPLADTTGTEYSVTSIDIDVSVSWNTGPEIHGIDVEV